MINKKILGLVGLAARARKVSFGADSVELQIKKRKVKLIIVAEDSSTRTKEKFIKLSEQFNIPIKIMGEIDELSKAIGKSNKAIIGIEDINLASEIQKINDTKNSIMICENLIKTKGFENSIIFVNDKSISVIVESEELKPEDVAKIQNIISREMKADIDNIHISTK